MKIWMCAHKYICAPLTYSKKSVYISATLIFQAKRLGTCVHTPSSSQLINVVVIMSNPLWTQQRWGGNQRNLQILSQQLDGDVKVCKQWKQERFRGLDDVAKTLGVVVNVLVATLLKLNETPKLANINMRRKDSVDFVAWSYCKPTLALGCNNANNKMRKRCCRARPNARRNPTSGIIPEQPRGNARALARRNLQQHGKFLVACVTPTEPILVCGWKTARGRANSGFPSLLATSNGLGVTWWLNNNLIEQFNAS